jgi:hypothetical protein
LTAVAIQSNLQKTLNSGELTTLFNPRFAKTRLTLTGISGEFTTIPFKTRTHGFKNSDAFEASQVVLTLGETIPLASILATTPDGVATLDIVYEVRTGRNA